MRARSPFNAGETCWGRFAVQVASIHHRGMPGTVDTAVADDPAATGVPGAAAYKPSRGHAKATTATAAAPQQTNSRFHDQDIGSESKASTHGQPHGWPERMILTICCNPICPRSAVGAWGCHTPHLTGSICGLPTTLAPEPRPDQGPESARYRPDRHGRHHFGFRRTRRLQVGHVAPGHLVVICCARPARERQTNRLKADSNGLRLALRTF